jgi:hypothetical protein
MIFLKTKNPSKYRGFDLSSGEGGIRTRLGLHPHSLYFQPFAEIPMKTNGALVSLKCL